MPGLASLFQQKSHFFGYIGLFSGYIGLPPSTEHKISHWMSCCTHQLDNESCHSGPENSWIRMDNLTIRQHTATHGNTRQHTATHCNTLQHAATHCNTLLHTATHCYTLQRIAKHCNTLQHTTTHCYTLQHTATHCNILQQWPGNDASAFVDLGSLGYTNL